MDNTTDLFYLITAIIGGFTIGSVCGILPLVVGIIRKKLWLGILGIVFCAAFGTLMTAVLHRAGFLSLFPAAAIAGLILFLTRKKT